jgi:hypothetical protein
VNDDLYPRTLRWLEQLAAVPGYQQKPPTPPTKRE